MPEAPGVIARGQIPEVRSWKIAEIQSRSLRTEARGVGAKALDRSGKPARVPRTETRAFEVSKSEGHSLIHTSVMRDTQTHPESAEAVCVSTSVYTASFASHGSFVKQGREGLLLFPVCR